MKIINYKEMEPQVVQMDGVQGATIRWLISKDDGAPNFAMRLFELEPNGFTPLHQHDWEHEVFVIEGQGEVYQDNKYIPIETGTAIFTKPNELHQFRNTGQDFFKFLCLIPYDDS